MRRFLRSVALSMTILYSVVPAAAAICQWACADPGTHAAMAHHQHGGTHDAGAATAAADAPGLRSATTVCDPAAVHETAVAPSSPRLSPPHRPSPAHALAAAYAPFVHVSYSTHSPPGGRSAPLSLRI